MKRAARRASAALVAVVLAGCALPPSRPARSPACQQAISQILDYLMLHIELSKQFEYRKAEVALAKMDEAIKQGDSACPPSEMVKYHRTSTAAHQRLEADLDKYGKTLGQ